MWKWLVTAMALSFNRRSEASSKAGKQDYIAMFYYAPFRRVKLAEDTLNNLAVDVGQSPANAVVIIGELLVIQTQQV